MNDPVNHPSHYTSGSIEVIDFLEDQNFPFHLANAVKYISRAGKKDPDKTVEDLQKAVWYINRYINFISKSGATCQHCKFHENLHCISVQSPLSGKRVNPNQPACERFKHECISD